MGLYWLMDSIHSLRRMHLGHHIQIHCSTSSNALRYQDSPVQSHQVSLLVKIRRMSCSHSQLQLRLGQTIRFRHHDRAATWLGSFLRSPNAQQNPIQEENA